MASQVGVLRAILNLDASGFRQGFERAQSAANTFQKRMRSVEFRMKRFGRKMEGVGRSMTLGITAPLGALAVSAVKAAADFETLGVQMEVLTGSAEEGAAAFERLKEFARKTPFELKDLTRANNALLGYGETAQEAFVHLKMLGDIAAVTGGDLQGMTRAFGQASAEGKLMTRDIRQLINQGVPAIKLLSESMGVAKSEIFDLASQGEITFEILVKAMEDATREGGLFANGAERLSTTLAGLFSTLKGDVSFALGELGKAISETLDLKQVVKNISATLQNITDRFRAMSDESRMRILKLAAALAAGGPLLIGLGLAVKAFAGLSAAIRGLFSPISLVIGAIAGIVVVGQNLIDNWELISLRLKKIFLELKLDAFKMAGGMAQAISMVTLDKTLAAQMSAVVGIFDNKTKEMLFDIGLLERRINDMDVTGLADPAQNAMNKVKDIFFKTWQSIMDSFPFPLGGGSVSGGGGGDEATPGVEGRGMGMNVIAMDLKNATAAATGFGSATQAAFAGVKKQTENLSGAFSGFGSIATQVLDRLLFASSKLKNILASIGRQLASRAIVTALKFVFGGPAEGASFFGSLFGGFFAHGGIAPAGKLSVVGEAGPELIMPRSPVNVQPFNKTGLNITVTGVLKGSGKELVGVIKDVNHTIGR